MNIYNTPVTIYHKVMEDNSFESLINSKTKHSRKILKGNALYIWDRLTGQMIDEFGVSHEVEMIFHKQNTINKCELSQILNDNNEHNTLIQILQSEIDLLKGNIEKKTIKDIRKHHARLCRLIEERYHRDPKKLTIFEFYNDLHDLKDEAEQRDQKDRPKKVAHG